MGIHFDILCLFKMHPWIGTYSSSLDIKASVVCFKETQSRFTKMDIACSRWLIYPITDKNSLEVMDGHFSLSDLVVVMLTYQIDESKVSQNHCARSFLPHGCCCRHKSVFWVCFMLSNITETITHPTALLHPFETDLATKLLSKYIFNRSSNFWKF